jgi:hypothetical protein
MVMEIFLILRRFPGVLQGAYQDSVPVSQLGSMKIETSVVRSNVVEVEAWAGCESGYREPWLPKALLA